MNMDAMLAIVELIALRAYEAHCSTLQFFLEVIVINVVVLSIVY